MALVEGPAPARGIGRARELATLAFARDSARSGRGSMLVVSGPPGIGKTWLCESAVRAARDEGFQTGWGAGWPDGDAPALWPWRQALQGGDEPSFQRFVAIVDALQDATRDHPALIVIDDLHAADEPTVQLARFVGRHLRGLHAVVLVAHRPVDRPALEALQREGTPLPLSGLAGDEVAAILAASGLDDLRVADLAFLMRVTAGRPFDVQALALAAADPAAVADRRGAVLRAVIDARLATLPAEVCRVAARAAVVGPVVPLADLAAVSDGDDPDPVSVRAALVGAALAQGASHDELRFAHDEVVAALRSVLSPRQTVDIHARVADLLAGRSPGSAARLAQRARHAIAAGGRSTGDARAAVAAAEEAASALARANDHAQAAELLAAVRETSERQGLGRPHASVLAAHATAVLHCGRLAEARELFAGVAIAAEEDGDVPSLAVAALGLGGVWVAEQRSLIDRERVLGLQRRARAELPAEQVVLRCRLDVRLAAEEAFATGEGGELEKALAAARALGDPDVLAEALSLYHHTLLGPESAPERLPVARELISVASDSGDALWSLMGLCWLTVDLFLAGQAHATRSLGDLHQRADALSCRSIGYVADAMDTMLLMRAGRLDEAERAAARCLETGLEVGDADAVAYYGAQLVVTRWLQGRSDEVLSLAADTSDSPTLMPANHAFTAAYACLAADCGEVEQAHAALTRLRGARLGRMRRTSAFMATLFTVIEAAYLLGDAAAAAEAAAMLEPHADLPVMGSIAVVCLGSPRRSLGLAALTAGEVDAAIEQLRLAVDDNERLGNRPMAAMTRAELARALLARGAAADRGSAIELLDHAVREGGTMGMTARADTWRQRRMALDDSARSRVTVDDDASTGVIRRQGRSWVLATGGREVVVPDLVGMVYLAKLFVRPYREISAVVLAGTSEAEAAVSQVEQPVLDERALAEYRRRVAELEDDLAEAERFADTERAAQVRAELDAFVDELTRSTNVHGRARPFGSSAERARTAVRKAVRRAFDQIEAVDPALGAALRSSVQTGRTCCYRPGPGAPRRWVTAD